MAAGERFSFQNAEGLPSSQLHQLVGQRLPLLRAWAHRLMETGGIIFEAQEAPGVVREVSHEYIAGEFRALERLGYSYQGEYQGPTLPHEAVDIAEAFLASLRRDREA